MDDRQQRIAARNEVRFRALNELVKSAVDELRGAGDEHSFEALCECALPDCDEMIEIMPEQYAAVREVPTRFIVVPQHIQPAVERVLEDHGTFWVVEKTGAGADGARQEP